LARSLAIYDNFISSEFLISLRPFLISFKSSWEKNVLLLSNAFSAFDKDSVTAVCCSLNFSKSPLFAV
jgi:hypothetical protein